MQQRNTTHSMRHPARSRKDWLQVGVADATSQTLTNITKLTHDLSTVNLIKSRYQRYQIFPILHSLNSQMVNYQRARTSVSH